ncbi:MAG: tetratricopeptide repeat protein [Verrucomicrobia bacterium]|nr:tetratricopeptide repeat protein [Verrucomicrobiota bacterium]
MRDMLQGVGPSVAGGRDTTLLQEILDQTVTRLDQELHNQPQVRSDLCNTIGRVYFELGQYESAESMYRQSIETMKHFDPDHVVLADALHNLADLLRARGTPVGAEEAGRRVLGIYTRSTVASTRKWERPSTRWHSFSATRATKRQRN